MAVAINSSEGRQMRREGFNPDSSTNNIQGMVSSLTSGITSGLKDIFNNGAHKLVNTYNSLNENSRLHDQMSDLLDSLQRTTESIDFDNLASKLKEALDASKESGDVEREKIISKQIEDLKTIKNFESTDNNELLNKFLARGALDTEEANTLIDSVRDLGNKIQSVEAVGSVSISKLIDTNIQSLEANKVGKGAARQISLDTLELISKSSSKESQAFIKSSITPLQELIDTTENLSNKQIKTISESLLEVQNAIKDFGEKGIKSESYLTRLQASKDSMVTQGVLNESLEFLQELPSVSDEVAKLKKSVEVDGKFSEQSEKHIRELLQRSKDDLTPQKTLYALNELRTTFKSNSSIDEEGVEAALTQNSLMSKFIDNPDTISKGKSFTESSISTIFAATGLGGLDKFTGLDKLISSAIFDKSSLKDTISNKVTGISSSASKLKDKAVKLGSSFNIGGDVDTKGEKKAAKRDKANEKRRRYLERDARLKANNAKDPSNGLLSQSSEKEAKEDTGGLFSNLTGLAISSLAAIGTRSLGILKSIGSVSGKLLGTITSMGATMLSKGADLAKNALQKGVSFAKGILPSKDAIMSTGSKVGSKAGGMLSKGVNLLKGAGKFLGPAAMLASAGYDAYQGISNADSITGKNARDLTMTDKVMAGASGAVSGLTFGLVDAKSVYDGGTKVADFAGVTDKGAAAITGKAEGDITTTDKVASVLSRTASNLTLGMVEAKDVYKAGSDIADKIFSFFGGDEESPEAKKAKAKVAETYAGSAGIDPTAQLPVFDSTGTIIGVTMPNAQSVEAIKQKSQTAAIKSSTNTSNAIVGSQMKTMEASSNVAARPVVINQPAQQNQTKPSIRAPKRVNDYGLRMINNSDL